MPLPNFAHLQADPALLLPWLEKNLLKAAATVTNVPPPHTTAMSMIPALSIAAVPHSDPAVAVNTNGAPMDVFDLVSNSPAGPNTLPAYVCNYTAGGVEHVDLGNAADYVFTINLNGCTFGIGPAVGAARRVSHANSGGNTIPQRTQTQIRHGVGPNLAGITLLEPAEYRRLGPNLQATVFGIRTGHSWKFYFQSYSSHGVGNFRVYGVFPILAP